MYTKKERAEYNERRKRVAEKMGLKKHEYNYYRRVGQKLHEASENSAMGSSDWRHSNNPKARYEEKEHGKDVASAFKKASSYRKKHGHNVHFYHQTDPRGAALYMGKERMSQKDYTSKGEPIY